jgi:integrase
LYYPDIEPNKSPKPQVVENIFQLKRKETSIYKPTDLCTVEDDLLFLKYCPSKRDKCYHMISRDTACRPHEILKLRLKDITFKTTAGGEGRGHKFSTQQMYENYIVPLINAGYIDRVDSKIDRKAYIFSPY